MRNWQDISYLKIMGTRRQQEAFETTMALGILEKLAPFHPTLVSTVCVGFDIEDSLKYLAALCRSKSRTPIVI